MMTLAVAASVLIGILGQPGGGGGGGERQPGGIGTGNLKPEPVPVTAGRVFADLRDSIQQDPIAERLTVTVRQPEQSPVSANIVLRIAPGRRSDLRDAKVSIDAGTLRIFARGATPETPGELTAVSTANTGAYYRVSLSGPPTLAAISDALLPLPLPTLAACFSSDGALADPTPLTRRISWQGTTRLMTEPHAPITLTGEMEGKPGQPVAINLEYQQDRLRLRSFTAPLNNGAGRSITVTAAWLEPSDPASWPIDVSNRVQVETLAGLGAKIEPAEPVKKADEPKKDASPGEPAKEPPPATTPPAKRGPEP